MAKQKGIGVKQASKQLCLGSDFDGLINAIDCCKSSNALPSFKSESAKRFPNLLKQAKLDIEGLDINEFLEDLFYRNGRDFCFKQAENAFLICYYNVRLLLK